MSMILHILIHLLEMACVVDMWFVTLGNKNITIRLLFSRYQMVALFSLVENALSDSTLELGMDKTDVGPFPTVPQTQ